ncbi:MAG TPA: hypothetical protein VFH51_17160, partial [Myxococcota bacterium]|nr:hypothetical protein [Myxococcota bacterium]
NVVWKLGRILEIHRPLFRALAIFLLEDHRVTLVEGNHDAEVYFPEVRQALTDELVRLAQAHLDRGGGRGDPAALATRLSFCSWFTAAPGRYHIEHGHQYDQFCSFEYKLAPYDKGDGRVLATPLSHRPLPYLAETLGDFSTHGIGHWSWRQLGRFVVSLGPRVLWTVARLYVVLGYELLRQAGPQRREELAAHAAAHDEQLRALSEGGPYSLGTLRALDGLKALPAEYSILKMLHVFYLDRLLWTGASLAAAGLGGLCAGASAALGGLAVWGLGLWGLESWRIVDARPALRAAAARIAGLTGARYVVFGHSHDPEVIDLQAAYGVGAYGDAVFYLNSGSWVTREILRGEAGLGMTFVEITGEGATLKRWVGPDRPPRVLAGTRGVA